MAIAAENSKLERARAARAAGSELEQFLIGSPAEEWKIVVSSGDGDLVLDVPRPALERLADVLDALGQGHVPSVIPMETELSTGELAELLGVSRQYAVRLLDDGRLPCRRVGNRRRIALTDALTYLRCDDKRRKDALHDLAASLII